MTPPQSARILVVEDNESIVLGLRVNLQAAGYEVQTATDGRAGLELAQNQDWDLIVLDVMLPGLNGFEVVCSLRADQDQTPILILSARDAELDRIMGLDLGADDYLTKPFHVGELMARIRALLRRRAAEPDPVMIFGDVEVDLMAREVHRAGQPVELTATEFSVLAVLLQAGGRALTRSQIMGMVWGGDYHGTPRTVDNFMAQLRGKLENDPARPAHILTVRGVGYRCAK